MEKAIIYARVSTKEQAEEGYSLASQLRLLREYAEKNPLGEIVKEFIVPESASGRQERTTFKEMMSYCKQYGISHILCEKVDRITRNLQDAVLIDTWLQGNPERRVHFVKQNLVIHQNSKSYEKFQWDIYVVLSRQYSNNLSEETKKGLIEKAEEGWYPGPVKRGYISVGERGQKLWEIDRSESSEAWFIAKAFDLYASGDHTTYSIRDQLFSQGWMTSSGKKIGKSSIHRLLQDPFYCGKFVWNGQEYEGKHEPLITEELYDLVQKRLKRELKSGRYRKHCFIYTGLFRCGSCDSAITAEIQKGHIYYRCTHYKPCTERKFVREEIITRQILKAFNALTIQQPPLLEWFRFVLKDAHEAEKTYHAKVMSELNDKLERIKSRIDVLYDDKADQHINKELFAQKLKQYERQQTEVVKKIARHKESAIRYAKTASDILEVSQKARALFEKLDVQDKRMLFRFIVSDARLDKGELNFSYQKPFDKVREIATFEPEKRLGKQGQIEVLQLAYPEVLPSRGSTRSYESIITLFQELFGVLEFPQTFSEQAEKWASVKLLEDHTQSVTA